MTETGMSLGTPHYMSPEQAMGEREITAKSDVYALGCVTYEMLTGEPPFTGPTAQAIIARVMTEEPRSLTLQRKTIPPHVEAAVLTALSKLPADRFATAAQFARGAEPGRGRHGEDDGCAAGVRGSRRRAGGNAALALAPWAVALVAIGGPRCGAGAGDRRDQEASWRYLALRRRVRAQPLASRAGALAGRRRTW